MICIVGKTFSLRNVDNLEEGNCIPANLEKCLPLEGRKFESYEALETFIKEYESAAFIQLWTAHSRTIEGARKRGFKRFVKDELRYTEIFFKCIYGGSMRSRSTGKRQRRSPSNKQDCPFRMRLKVSSEGNTLDIVEVMDGHNHIHTKESYSSLPRQKLLDAPMKAIARHMLKLKAKKKPVQKETSSSTCNGPDLHVSPANLCEPILMQDLHHQGKHFETHSSIIPVHALPANVPILMQEVNDQVGRKTGGLTVSDVPVRVPEISDQVEIHTEELTATCNAEAMSELIDQEENVSNETEVIQCALVFLQKCNAVVQLTANELIVRNCEEGIITKEVRFSDGVEVFCYEKQVPRDHSLVCTLNNATIIPENVEGLNELINTWHSCRGITNNGLKDAYSKMSEKDQGRICRITNSVHSIKCTLLTKCKPPLCEKCRRYCYSLQRAYMYNGQKRKGICVRPSSNMNRYMTHVQVITTIRSIKERLKRLEKRYKNLRQ